jgi:hypothetical protein
MVAALTRSRRDGPAVGDPGPVAVGLGGIGAALAVAGRLGLPRPVCPLRLLTGVPCPGCGFTHLADDLVGGHLATALRADPAAVAAALALAVVAGVHVVARLRGRPSPTRGRAGAIYLVVGVLVAIHWATTVWTGGLLTT